MKYSIIIPAYNAEKDIEKAVRSINRSFVNTEVIIINDGSKDNTLNVCQKLQEEFEYLKVINTENYGVSNARNIGLENAIGEYIMFVDADDEILDFDFNQFDACINDTDFIVYSFIEQSKKTKEFLLNNSTIEKEDISTFFLENHYNMAGPWAKIYKRSIIQEFNLRFIVGQKYSEDTTFVLEYLSKINSILTNSLIIYKHNVNPNGACSVKKYYPKMNEYLYNQFLAFSQIATCTTNNKRCLASKLFYQCITHYYCRVNKKEFFTIYEKTFNLFKEFVSISEIKKYRFFNHSFIKKEINCKKIIGKLYFFNKLYKIKYFIKTIFK